jgi:type I restriction enzyme S subunit
MNNDWFFEKFALIADAPGAIPIMRELIIQFAVRGKLTGHIVGESTKEEIELLLGFKGCGEDSETPNSEVNPFSIPANWRWVRVGDSVNMINGKAFKPEDWSINGVPIIRIQNLNKEHATFNRCNTKIDSKYHVNNDDFLISWSGTPGTSFGAFIWNRGFAYLNQHIFRCELAPGVFDKKFLRVAINARLDEMISYAQGAVGLRHITKGKLESIRIPLPPLAEQERIVAKVDELMGLCDALEAQQQERELRKSVLVRSSLSRFAEAPTPENLGYLFHKSYDIPPSELRKSILTLAVQGKLVPQDPSDEPAEKILARIDSMPKRAMRTKEGAKEVDESTESEVLYDLPSGWQWVPFRRLPLQASVGVDRGRSTQGSDKAFGYFKMNNIRNSGGIDLSDLTRIDAKPNEVEAFSLANGDFLFNTRNSRELVGKTCVFRSFSDDPILYNNNILRVRFIEGFSPEFLDCWFRSPQGKAELEKLKSNTTNVCAIYQGKLSCFPCAIPPLAEQHRIVAKVDQLMALVDELERQQAASREKATTLLDAIAHEMTSGGQGIAATSES